MLCKLFSICAGVLINGDFKAVYSFSGRAQMLNTGLPSKRFLSLLYVSMTKDSALSQLLETYDCRVSDLSAFDENTDVVALSGAARGSARKIILFHQL